MLYSVAIDMTFLFRLIAYIAYIYNPQVISQPSAYLDLQIKDQGQEHQVNFEI